jgi:hypothetical protein
MPLSYRIDPDRRLVVTRGNGVLKDHEVFDYQNEVWSRADVAGYDELIDMSDVTQILLRRSNGCETLPSFQRA